MIFLFGNGFLDYVNKKLVVLWCMVFGYIWGYIFIFVMCGFRKGEEIEGRFERFRFYFLNKLNLFNLEKNLKINKEIKKKK